MPNSAWRHKWVAYSCLFLCTIFGGGTLATAGVAYSDLGSPPSYQCCTGWDVSGIDSGVGLTEEAMEFTSLASGNVSEIDVALSYILGANSATVSMWTSVNGIPGAELGSWAVSNQPVFGTTDTLLTSIQVSGITVTQGQQYFIVVAGDATTYDAWNLNDQGILGQVAQNNGSGWEPGPGGLGGMEILTAGTAPEPGSAVLFGSGVTSLGLVLRRRLRHRK